MRRRVPEKPGWPAIFSGRESEQGCVAQPSAFGSSSAAGEAPPRLARGGGWGAAGGGEPLDAAAEPDRRTGVTGQESHSP